MNRIRDPIEISSDDISTENQGADGGYMFILANFTRKNPISTTTEEKNWTINSLYGCIEERTIHNCRTR